MLTADVTEIVLAEIDVVLLHPVVNEFRHLKDLGHFVGCSEALCTLQLQRRHPLPSGRQTKVAERTRRFGLLLEKDEVGVIAILNGRYLPTYFSPFLLFIGLISTTF